MLIVEAAVSLHDVRVVSSASSAASSPTQSRSSSSKNGAVAWPVTFAVTAGLCFVVTRVVVKVV